MHDLLSITWQSLCSPIPLALIVVLLMQLFGKKLIDLLVDLLPEKRKEQLRSLIINLVTWGLCYLIAALHINTLNPDGELVTSGMAFVVSLQAVTLSTGIYQGGKSVAKVFGMNGSQ